MSKLRIRAVIMAGGRGTRFWPLSRRNKPKQFLAIVSEKTMLEETVERLSPLIPWRDIYAVANLSQTKAIRAALPSWPKDNLLVEPLGKNTAPSLILATAWIYLHDPKAVVAALPADHLIRDPDLFRKKLRAGAQAASLGDAIVTVGIPPSYPATGYGYIHFERGQARRVSGETFFQVREFKEKPNTRLARHFLKKGNYYWNSGMFIWRADVFAHKLEKYAPSLFPFWEMILEALQKRNRRALTRLFQGVPSISIDYALMEKAEGVLVCEGNFGWSDVGAWSSLAEIWQRDVKGNAAKGEYIALESQNCLIYNPQRLTALVGVNDLIIVNTGDGLLVCPKSQDQKVREIIELVKKSGRTQYL